MALAHELDHSFSMILALSFFSFLRHFRREATLAREHAQAVTTLCTEQGVSPHYLATAGIVQGWAEVHETRGRHGIAEIRHALDQLEAMQVHHRRSYYFGILAEAYGSVGEPELGLGALTRAAAFMEETGEGLWEVEIHRLKGKLLLQSSSNGQDQAEASFRKVARLGEVEYAEPDVVDHACVIPSDTRYVEQWGLQKIGMPAAWDLETGGSNVLIGIIDSGISMSGGGALDHPDLNDPSRYIQGTDFVDGGTPRDLNGHGTHVAGIAAAESNNAQGVAGMNWGSQVYVCRTLDTSGNGGSADFADAVEEIVDYALAHGLKAVINYSAGGGDNQTKRDACAYVNDHGMILCAATGNDNGAAVIFPAAYSVDYDGVIAVGSTDSGDTVSSFSNIGPEVTVVAPGRDILSTMPTYGVTIPAALNYDELSGTSMATPCVTGLIALMWSRHPSFTNRKIRDCLTSTAVKLGAGTFDNSWGNGRVAAEPALRCGDVVVPAVHRVHALHHLHRLHPPHPLHAVHHLHALHPADPLHAGSRSSPASPRSRPSRCSRGSGRSGPVPRSRSCRSCASDGPCSTRANSSSGAWRNSATSPGASRA